MMIFRALYRAILWRGWLVSLALISPMLLADPLADTAFTDLSADVSSGSALPESLREWVPWLLDGDPELAKRYACALDAAAKQPHCAWPGVLQVELGKHGGRFSQHWRLDAPGWVRLPGSSQHWPLRVQADGQAVPTVRRERAPEVWLAAGEHKLTGFWEWPRVPEKLALAATTGMVSVRQAGETVFITPRLSVADERLWLRDPVHGPAREPAADDLRLQVYRRIDDRLPLRITTRLELDVAGRARELGLGPVTLPGSIPLAIDSPLPARLDADGRLWLQARPGRWRMTIDAYRPGAVDTLTAPTLPTPWPQQEVWAVALHPSLRRVALTGLSALDPRQISLPEQWARLPVYLARPGERLRFEQQARGDAAPGPDQLHLERDLWLDFDASGYTARDHLTGQLRDGWRIDADPALKLGQVTAGGRPWLVTTRGDDLTAGVEIRQRDLDLTATSRLQAQTQAWPLLRADTLPMSAWARAFDSVETRLNLPPGWDLLAVSGVDNLPDTWLSRWSLLDLFLVLIVSLATVRLWGWRWGLVALLALGLTWQAPGAPRLVWAHLLAAIALLRVMPGEATSWLRWLLQGYFRLAVLALLITGLPFLVGQVRDGIYPDLAGPVRVADLESVQSEKHHAMRDTLEQNAMRDMLEQSAMSSTSVKSRSYADTVGYGATARKATPRIAPIPSELTQTGPGVTQWRWRDVELTAQGPIPPQRELRLWLLTPAWHLFNALVGALLLIALALRITALGEHRPLIVAPFVRRAPAAALLPALLLVWFAGSASRPVLAAEDSNTNASVAASATAVPGYPPAPLLKELADRLARAPLCAPDCLTVGQARLAVAGERLRLELTLDAATTLAAVVPGGSDGWLPETVVIDKQGDQPLLRGLDGRLRVRLAPGRHRVVLEGALPTRQTLDLAFDPIPHRFSAQAEGWRIEGLDPDGAGSAQIRLIRESPGSTLTQGALPPLLEVTRALHLETSDWRVETRIRRLSDTAGAVLIEVPLLVGEALQTEGLQTHADAVQLVLAAGQVETGWSSRLDPLSPLRLDASRDQRLTERWTLDLAPAWHLQATGPAPVFDPDFNESDGADAQLTWYPLPGESLRLTLTRPVAVPGQTLTIDRLDYRVQPGGHAGITRLTLALRSSAAGRHAIDLPVGAGLTALVIDGVSQPFDPTSRRVEIPLIPGARTVMLEWRTAAALPLRFTPALADLHAPVVNRELAVELPRDRWVLFTWGPGIGPAVLFWGVALVLLVLAGLLGRTRLTPLRFLDWLLLGIGVALAQIWIGLLVAGWLFALALRRRLSAATPPWRFDLLQLALAGLTLLALAGIFVAVQQGLLGHPEMQVLGNGSNGHLLRWYLDRSADGLEPVWIVSLPIWVYRAAMLAWALWLALRLLDWLRWGWQGISTPVLWRSLERSQAADRSSAAQQRTRQTQGQGADRSN